jgi:drug/metabolite transporter (DMT)-like permease
MTVPHLLLALGTAMAWGLNYVAIGQGVRDVPPMLLAALRFACAALPLVLVVPRPRLPFRHLAQYTLTMFVLQFGLLFTGIRLGPCLHGSWGSLSPPGRPPRPPWSWPAWPSTSGPPTEGGGASHSATCVARSIQARLTKPEKEE